MAGAWTEQRGVAGRQRAKQHSDVIVELSTQTASQRAASAAGIFSLMLLVFSQHIVLNDRTFQLHPLTAFLATLCVESKRKYGMDVSLEISPRD